MLPPALNEPLRGLGAGKVEAEKGTGWDVEEELGAVGYHGGAETVEDGYGQAEGVAFLQHHDRWDGAHDGGFRDAAGAVAAEESDYFSAAGGMTNKHHVFKVQVLEDGEEIIRVGVHVVSIPGLAGSPMTSTIVGDDTVAVISQEEHF